MNLHIPTVLFLTTLSTFFIAIGIFMTARSYTDNVQGMRRWAWACGVQSIGWALAYGRGHLPDFLSIIVANVLLIWCVALSYQALCEFADKPSMGFFPYLPVLCVFTTFIYYTYAEPNISARIVVGSLCGAVLFLLCAHTILWGKTARLPFSYWMTGVGFVLCSVFSFLRAFFIVVFKPSIPGLFSPSPVQSVTYTCYYISTVLITYGFLLMCNDKFHAKLHRLATSDPLTESLNRRALELLLQKELARSLRRNAPLSLLMLDVDHFKTINDTYGHGVGDTVLKRFVEVISQHLRSQDALGRYGGEEFAVVLPDTDSKGALIVAERMRQQIEQSRLVDGHEALQCTISIGVATLDPKEADHASLMHRADAALYEAKRQGRNRVIMASPDP